MSALPALNWSASHFEGIRDADAQGAEALAVALKGHLKGRRATNETVEEVTPTGGVSLRICPSWRHDIP